MKRLFDAFLELPTWQGCLIIAGAVIFVGAIFWIGARCGYRIGRADSDQEHLHYSTKQREREAIRL